MYIPEFYISLYLQIPFKLITNLGMKYLTIILICFFNSGLSTNGKLNDSTFSSSKNLLDTEYETPIIQFATNHTFCDTLIADIRLRLTNNDLSTWNGQATTNWYSDAPELSFTNSTDTSVRVTATNWGTYNIYYSISTTEGLDTTLKSTLGFNKSPSSDFTITGENGNCREFVRTVSYEEDASNLAILYWDLGMSQRIGGITNRNFAVSLGIGDRAEISLVVEDKGCFSDTTRVEIPTIPNSYVTADPLQACDSSLVSFSANLLDPKEVNYIWSFDNGLTSKEQNPQTFYSEPKLYDVELEINNSKGCKAKYRFKDFIKIYQTPQADFIADPDFCYGDSIELIHPGDIDSITCNWYFNDNLYEDTNDTIKVRLENPLTEVTLQTDNSVCFSEPVSKIIKRKPQFDFSLEESEACQLAPVNFIADSPEEPLSYTWLINNEVAGTEQSLTKHFPDTGYFEIKLIAYSELTSCIDTLSKSIPLIIYPKPKAFFTTGTSYAYLENAEITFNNLSENAINYYWDFGDGHTSQEINPKNFYTSEGLYMPQLIAESEKGCSDTISSEIDIRVFNFFCPNAFRPNSEIAENRLFMPLEGNDVDPDKIHVQIFDRWGQIVFESFNMSNKWDGKTIKGQKAPMENYIWIATFSDALGTQRQQKGQVLLIR